MSLLSFGKTIAIAQDRARSRPNLTAYPIGVQLALESIPLLDDAEPALIEAINRRIALFDRAASDLEFRTEEILASAKDPVSFFNNWVWTYDPRRSPSTIPFDLFEKQAEFIYWLQDRLTNKEDGVVEKSRDAGLSFLCCGFAAHQLLFVPGSKTTFGSRKAKLVDELGNPDCLFEKIRIIMRNIPPWMHPKNYGDNTQKLINQDKGTSVTGEAGDNMGRGGRSRLYFLDEFAFVERAKRVDAAVSENSQVKIYVSTPNGIGNPFYVKRFSGDLPVFQSHWKDDPRKNGWELRDGEGNITRQGNGRDAPLGAIYPWYEKRKKTLDKIIVAQEIDIDYAASQEGVVIPNEWVMAAVDLKLPAIGDRVGGLDISDEGEDLNVFIIRQGVVVKLNWIYQWELGNTTQTAYKARDIGRHERIKYLNYDGQGVGSGTGGTLKSCNDLPFKIQSIMGSGSVSDKFYPSFDREAGDLFGNLRAELWWSLRQRFEKTFEYVNREHDHPIAELISIPNHPTLIAQLSQPLYRFNDSGLIYIEGKPEMKKRGIKSPDHADALTYAFAPRINLADFDWMKNS
jgi:phage terminase large subunit